jgi:trans-aconitate 2-methyltransferase
MWDAEQYLRFETERARPFFDLVAAIEHPHPRIVADLGCGPGGLTATLLARWPDAVIWGIDESDEMIDHARRRAVIDRLRFEPADVSRWQAPGPLDVIVSNACFQWIPDHVALFDHLLPQLAESGWLAFQVPNNFDEPSHEVVWADNSPGPGVSRERRVTFPAVPIVPCERDREIPAGFVTSKC